jgi:glycosyltransferase involved in cell wall biosynthesis
MDNVNLQISVVIPTFNREKTIRRAIDSVLNQDLLPCEIIVVDDGSTDKTYNILKSYNTQIKAITQIHSGVSSARNRGIKEAKGLWIAFLDSDDEWLPNKLSEQFAYLQKHPKTRILQSDEQWIRNKKKVNTNKKYLKKSGNIFKDCLKTCIVSPSTVICERFLLLEIGGFDEDLPVCEDYDLWIRIAARYPIPLLDKVLINKYGGHADQLSLTTPAMDKFRVQSLEKIVRDPSLSSSQRKDVLNELILKLGYLYEGAIRRQKDVELYGEKLKKYDKKW